MASVARHSAPRLLGGFRVETLLVGVFLLVGAIVFLKAAAEPHAYSAYLAMHTLAAVVWVGGDATLTVLGIVFERRGDNETLAALGRAGAWIGSRVYTPAVFVVLGFGIALMLEGDIPWNQFWILFGLAGWATATVLGVAVIGPQVTGINRAALAYGPESDELVRRTRRLFLIFRFDAALLLLIVLDMALKPFA